MIHHALRIQWLSVAWLVLEAAGGLLLAWFAHSLALLAFGWDSVLELISALVLAGRLGAEARGVAGLALERMERRASGVVGGLLLLLAGYVVVEAGRDLWLRNPSDASVGGLVLAAVSGVVMTWLVKQKHTAACAIGSKALEADACCGTVCVYMAISLFLGLAANAVFGWWWADPAAALAIAYYAAKEGWEAWQQARRCDDCVGCGVVCWRPACACACC